MKMMYRGSDREVMKGDHVEVKYHLRWRKGIVTYVYDPSKPSPPRGDNDMGYDVKLEDGKTLLMQSSSKGVRFGSRRSEHYSDGI